MITITHTRLRQAASLVVGLAGMVLGISLGFYLIDQGSPLWLANLWALGITFSGIIASTFGFCELDRRADGWGTVYVSNSTVILTALLTACGLTVAALSFGHVELFILSVWCVVGLALLLALVNMCYLAVVAFHLMFERVWEEEADE